MAEDQSSNSDYFPWTWTIQSLDKTKHTCPSVSHLLGTFAAVNGVVSLLAVIFGHRRVVQKLTCGAFGERGSRSWIYMWIIPVGLQLAANTFIALLIRNSVGYQADFKISEMMLFLVARPRLSWIVLGAFAFKSEKVKREQERERTRRMEKEARYQRSPNMGSTYNLLTPQAYDNTYSPWVSQQSFAKPTPYTSQVSLNPSSIETYDSDIEHPWWSAFMSQFIGEYILQIMSLYIMGRTAHFATVHDYYKIYLNSYWSIPPAARMMYSGALYYLVAGSLFLIFALIIILYTIFSRRTKWLGKASNGVIFVTLLFLLISTWTGSWIFWAGFVKLAGDLYCPPKLIHQGVIWTFFSGIGIVLGIGIKNVESHNFLGCTSINLRETSVCPRNIKLIHKKSASNSSIRQLLIEICRIRSKPEWYLRKVLSKYPAEFSRDVLVAFHKKLPRSEQWDTLAQKGKCFNLIEDADDDEWV